MSYKFIGFFKCAFVEQQRNPLAGRQLPLRCLAFPPLPSAAGLGQTIPLRQLSDCVLTILHVEDYRRARIISIELRS